MAQPLSSDVPTEPIHRLSVEQYRRMVEQGILSSGDAVELLEGILVEKMTKKPRHRIATHRARLALEAVVPSGWYVDSQEPIQTPDSEPEPDVCVIRGRTEDYAESNPPAAAVTLVVEVADVSLLRDRETKARIYSRASVPNYWIVNLVDSTVECLSEPSSAGDDAHYRTRTVAAVGETVTLLIDGREVARVAVADLLPD